MRVHSVLVRAVEAGVRVRLRVKPGARRDSLIGAHGDALKLEIRAAPERGKANEAVVRLLAKTFDVKRSDVVVVSGAGSQNKTVEIRDAEAATVVNRLRDAGIDAEVVPN
jgi:uncharacterized protein (TIGR00251 family)